MDGEVTTTGKVAVVAHYSVDTRVSLSMDRLVRELTDSGYRCIVMSTCQRAGALEWRNGVPASTTVLRRYNEGYDFGSWAVALRMFPEIRRLQSVILTNDSMVGPFAPMGPLLTAFEATPTDVWGVTDSHQMGHHIQSYFIGFRNAVLDEPAWSRFYGSVRHHAEKMDVVRMNELGIMRVCRLGGYPWTVHYRAADLGVGTENPTLAGWRTLLALGFPFVKRTIVSDPAVAPGGEQVGLVVKRKFGVDLAEWL